MTGFLSSVQRHYQTAVRGKHTIGEYSVQIHAQQDPFVVEIIAITNLAQHEVTKWILSFDIGDEIAGGAGKQEAMAWLAPPERLKSTIM